MELTDNQLNQIRSIVSFEAGVSQQGVPTGSRTEGRIFESKVQTFLDALATHSKIPTGRRVFSLYGFNREFDAPSWNLPNALVLFEAKSAKANKGRTGLDGNAHERLASQIHRAAAVAEKNPARPSILVVCLNGVWASLGANWLAEFQAGARRVERGCVGQLRVVFLSTEEEYVAFFQQIQS